ncbi:hypothetical protein P43SY_001987 [Pythium insidiosum]|uniref:Uncharacterized protein n=1 Tax=Pythium insidiosum TaxID=114742 RepID=A0AAD5LKS1_PYTIN|nr:hypothetical protein P43SY_001987 [Pythium insidiosum]
MPTRSFSSREQALLYPITRSNSERFARQLMGDAVALDSSLSAPDLEFVQSLNGIDVYENASERTASVTRLRSVCHVETHIGELARLVAAAPSSPESLSGIVECQALCSLLPSKDHDGGSRLERAHDERADVVTFCVTKESARESGVRRTTTGATDSDDEEPTIEFVALWYQGPFTHRSRRGWVQWCQSVELSHRDEPGTRGSLLSSGIVAVESATRPGQLSVSYAMGVELGAHSLAERRMLEAAVWRRVMKLAGLKKSLERASLARTVSIGSAACAQPQPESEPGTSKESKQATRGALPVLLPKPESEPEPTKTSTASSVVVPRSPSCLEFRLTYYQSPPEPDAVSTRPKSKSATWLR